MSDQPVENPENPASDHRRPGDGSETPAEPVNVAASATGADVGFETTSPSAQSESSSNSDTTNSSSTATATVGAWQPNTELLDSIVALGFNRNLAEKALFYGSNDSLERAVNWIIDYGDRFDDGQPLDISVATSTAVPAAGVVMTPHKMVFVVNSALKMGIGKIAAQVGHATLGLYRSMLGNSRHETALLQWNEEGETKVVLKADGGEEELVQLRSAAMRGSLPTYLVADAGRTQIASGSITVLSIFGPADRVDEVTGKLKLLQ